MPSSSQHLQRQPPRCLSHHFQAPLKCKKKKRKPTVFQCFSFSSHGTKIDQKCSQNRLRSSQVESKMAILPLAWLILKVSWPIWVATYAQASAIFAPTLLEFPSNWRPVPKEKSPRYFQRSIYHDFRSFFRCLVMISTIWQRNQSANMPINSEAVSQKLTFAIEIAKANLFHTI